MTRTVKIQKIYVDVLEEELMFINIEQDLNSAVITSINYSFLEETGANEGLEIYEVLNKNFIEPMNSGVDSLTKEEYDTAMLVFNNKE